VSEIYGVYHASYACIMCVMCLSLHVCYVSITSQQLQHELDTPGGATSAIACDASHVSCGLQDGWSALMHAVHKGHSEVVDKLISAGAKLDLRNKVRESGVPCGWCCRLICACVWVHACACVCMGEVSVNVSVHMRARAHIYIHIHIYIFL